MNHDDYIKRCVQLAKNGSGQTYPNPMVGALIVYKDQIIGEGWHQKAGKAHAEPKAIKSVKDLSLLKKSTLYVSLEPCAHHGKTPPCADLIIRHKIPKVVIGIQDIFAKVNGLGISKLKNAGCEVILSKLAPDCWHLNRRFFTFHEKKRPYIILKWAKTIDGYIDKPRDSKTPEQHVITNLLSRQRVHRWRSEEQAILIGKKTALNDNPKLSVRLQKGKNPIRIVIDRQLEIPKHFHLYDKTQPTFFLNENIDRKEGSLRFIKIDFENVPYKICDILYQHGIQSILIEGGRQTLQSFINSNLWDEARVFTGNKYFSNGLPSPILRNYKKMSTQIIQDDSVTLYQNNSLSRH